MNLSNKRPNIHITVITNTINADENILGAVSLFQLELATI